MTESTLEARALWLAAPGRAELRATALPPRAEGDVLVRATLSGMSRGTESLVFLGRVPPSQYDIMRCPFQEGAFPAPVKYGYASVGVVEEGPATLKDRRIFCLYPHQDRYRVPQEAVLPIPDDVSDRRAVLAANMETALNALWDAAPRLGDRIAIVGAGVVGCLVASLVAKLPGASVEIVDIDQRRAALAAAFGCGFATPEKAQHDCDLVIHASGRAAGLTTALQIAGFEATVLELSWYGDQPVPAPLGESFHSRRLTLRSSQVGEVATARRARRTRRQRLALALSLLADPIYDRLISGECGFEELPQVMARLATAPDGALCQLVRYAAPVAAARSL